MWVPVCAFIALIWALISSGVRRTPARTTTGYAILFATFAAIAIPCLVNPCPTINF
ncbi:MAG TPA: hypothetical protein VGG89_08660 [Candidatus Baltobacteraceae bacterium]